MPPGVVVFLGRFFGVEKGVRAGESVTFFTALGEDADGVQRYRVTRVDGVAVFRRGGVRRDGRQGSVGDDRAVLYVFERASGMKRSFVPEEVFDGMDERDDVWTVRTDGRDRVALGVVFEDVPPDVGAVYRPVSVEYHERGRPGLRHVRVVCA